MAVDYSGFPFSKGESRKHKALREAREEQAVKERVRAEVHERDGECRVYRDRVYRPWLRGIHVLSTCSGPGEWAHLEDRRRAHTVNESPDARHTTEWTMMLCRKHHTMYDKLKTLAIEFLDRMAGANGEVVFDEEAA